VSRRVLIALLAVTTLAVVAFFVPAAIAIRTTQQRERELEQRQDELELQREASVVATRVALGLSRDVLQPRQPDHVIGVYAPNGELVAGRGPRIATDDVTRLAIDGNIAEGRSDNANIAAVPVRLLDDGSAVVVRIEAPVSTSDTSFARSLLGLGGAALAILAVAAAVATWLSRRLNRPIDELRAWSQASVRGTDDAPPRTGIGEIDSLRDALVGSRTRIDELLQRERSFSSQVSHQLRTPVAAMRVAVEAEIEAPRPDRTTVLHESIDQLDRLESTITSLLALARDTAREPAPCDIGALIRERIVVWSRAAAVGRRIDVSAPTGDVTVDADALGHIVDVLVDNAMTHGQGAIRLTASHHANALIVDVADDGTTPSSSDVFAERGRDSEHGIGLRLARSLAESCNGSLSLLAQPTTTFRLTLPV
jgi:signal transduction histidine kinase